LALPEVEARLSHLPHPEGPVISELIVDSIGRALSRVWRWILDPRERRPRWDRTPPE
jgi:hypothetical protein